MTYELKAMGVGGILDQSIRVFKDHFGLFMTIMFCLQIPLNIIFQLLVVSMTPELPANPTPEEIHALMQNQMGSLLLLQSLFGIVIGLTVVPITQAALMYATSNIYLGRPVSIGEAFKVGLHRFVALAWTWFLVYILCMGGLLLCILPGILMFFRYALATNVAVLEGISGSAALKRSKQLMHSNRTKNYNTLFLLLLMLVVITYGVAIGSQYIPNRYAAAVVMTLLEAVNGAFWLIAMVVFYFSCRCRAENFDLMQLAQAVGETEAQTEMPMGDDPRGGGFR
jgi:hypothetical protein